MQMNATVAVEQQQNNNGSVSHDWAISTVKLTEISGKNTG